MQIQFNLISKNSIIKIIPTIENQIIIIDIIAKTNIHVHPTVIL